MAMVGMDMEENVRALSGTFSGTVEAGLFAFRLFIGNNTQATDAFAGTDQVHRTTNLAHVFVFASLSVRIHHRIGKKLWRTLAEEMKILRTIQHHPRFHEIQILSQETCALHDVSIGVHHLPEEQSLILEEHGAYAQNEPLPAHLHAE